MKKDKAYQGKTKREVRWVGRKNPYLIIMFWPHNAWINTTQIMMTSNHMTKVLFQAALPRQEDHTPKSEYHLTGKQVSDAFFWKLLSTFIQDCWLLVNDSWPCLFYQKMRSVELENLRWKWRGNIMTSYSNMNQSMTPHKNFFINNPIWYSSHGATWKPNKNGKPWVKCTTKGNKVKEVAILEFKDLDTIKLSKTKENLLFFS